MGDQRKLIGTGQRSPPIRDLLTVALGTVILVTFCITVLVARIFDTDVIPGYGADPWTSVDAVYNLSESIQPGLSIKQALVYGRWMQALEKNSLTAATVVHQSLLDGIRDCERPVAAERSQVGQESAAKIPSLPAVHSILTIWNCSATAIEYDTDIIGTLNQQANYLSHAYIELRPRSTMVDYISSRNWVTVADAVVLSLIYNGDSDAGRMWEENAASLAREQTQWQIYNKGDGAQSWAVRLQYRPAVVIDKVAFFAFYILVAAYAISNIRSVKCLDSKLTILAVVIVEV